jgi:hypothetical protein
VVQTEFQLRRDERGFLVYAITSWGDDRDSGGQAGGPACSVPFPSVEVAQLWAHEQFAVPLTAWQIRPDGTLRAQRV